MASKWDVVMVGLGKPVGHEQGSKRPAVVVSNDRMNHLAGLSTICPFTKTVRTLYPGEVQFAAGESGLPLASILMAHQIRTVSADRIGARLGEIVDPVRRRQVEDAIREVLEL